MGLLRSPVSKARPGAPSGWKAENRTMRGAAMWIALALKLNGTIAVRKALLVLAFAAISLQGLAAAKVTVEQLEKTVIGIAGRVDNDEQVTDRLTELELTERLSKARFERLSAKLPGERSKQALLALADCSAFLDLPDEDVLKIPRPDAKRAGKIVSRAADFTVETVSKMPSFYASRTTTRFEDLKFMMRHDAPVIEANQGFHFLDKSSATVLFRNGLEVVQTGDGKKKPSTVTETSGLTNWGIFGTLLGSVMTDVLKGKIGWGHWEQGPKGPLAVFRYAVEEDQSTYTVRYCCFRAENGEMHEFQAIPAYHGEIAIDPESGAVMRLVVKTDLESSLPMRRSDVAVEYGPVEIGGRTYICPLESTSISLAEKDIFHRYMFYVDKKGKPDDYVGNKLKTSETVSLPLVTAINHVVFGNYHQFRGDMRILPAEGGETNVDVPATPPTLGPGAPVVRPPQ